MALAQDRSRSEAAVVSLSCQGPGGAGGCATSKHMAFLWW